MNVLIVGAGIGGLAAALALEKIGCNVTLVEKRESLAPVGAGIILAPNALEALQWLGVAIKDCARSIPSFTITRADGRVLSQVTASALPFGPIHGCTRAGLHAALQAAIGQRMALHCRTTFEKLQTSGHGVDVTWQRLETQTVRPNLPSRFDLVVGADGLHSQVREAVHGSIPLLYSGVSCYRGLVANPGIDGAIEAWGGRSRMGMAPVEDGKLYYFLVTAEQEASPALAWPQALLQRFAHFGGDTATGKVLQALPAAPPLHHDLFELARIVWGTPHIVLLGDAAHAMTPNQGQGAAMAIEDALALAHALAPGFAGFFARYCEARHERVNRVKRDSRRLGMVAQWQNPWAQNLRNALFQVTPQALAIRQLRTVVEPGLHLLTKVQALIDGASIRDRSAGSPAP